MVHDILNYLGEKIGELDDTGMDLSRVAVILNEYAKAPVAPVMKDVTPRQIRQAIILSGLSVSNIEATLDSLPEPMKSLAKIEWEYSIAFQRNRPLVNQVAAVLGITQQQLDELWELAASL